jgi:hypothetical protein
MHKPNSQRPLAKATNKRKPIRGQPPADDDAKSPDTCCHAPKITVGSPPPAWWATGWQPPAQATDTTTPTQPTTASAQAYAAVVAEGKAILSGTYSGELQLGMLADQLPIQYGAKTLAKFAQAIGIAPWRLSCYRRRYRRYSRAISIYRAWNGDGGES